MWQSADTIVSGSSCIDLLGGCRSSRRILLAELLLAELLLAELLLAELLLAELLLAELVSELGALARH
jgi:hypothetical protein